MDVFAMDVMGKPLWAWLGFFAVVLLLLVFDLGVLNRRDHVIGARESLGLSAFYISVGLLFAGWIYVFLGPRQSVEYLTAFLVEKSLAMDNIFVIATIFAYFAIPRQYQHRVLVFGIIGVIVLRAIMIGLGAAVVEEFEWVLYVFAVFLIGAGIKMAFGREGERSLADNRVLRFLDRHLYVTERLHGQRFFVRRAVPGVTRPILFVTPLFVALVMIELADIVFAVDSIPAVFSITTDPYVVYTSNIFAILGLRALYFALSVMIARFDSLKYALALVLVFIGAKVLAEPILGIEELPPQFSLAVTVAILGVGVLYSFLRTRGEGGVRDNALPAEHAEQEAK